MVSADERRATSLDSLVCTAAISDLYNINIHRQSKSERDERKEERTRASLPIVRIKTRREGDPVVSHLRSECKRLRRCCGRIRIEPCEYVSHFGVMIH